jgi:acetolactate synthase-1/2/3 large subunit
MKNGMPRFDEVAKAYGLNGTMIYNLQDFKTKLIEEENSNIACLFDVDVIDNENCYPMVAPGRSNSQMIGLEKK